MSIIAIDFDGTLCEHRFPEIGMENPGAFRWLKEFQAAGARLILYTMRSDKRSEGVSAEGHPATRDYLTEAIDWCRERGVEFWAHNCNPEQKSWTDSPKVYAHIYIDDAAHGCPMREMPRAGSRDAVDWEKVGPAVLAKLRSPA